MTIATDISLGERIIWSADVPNMKALLRLLDQMPLLKVIKIDQLFILKNGLDVLSQLRERGLKVFADGKITEIPSKAESIAELYLEHRPWMLNCMATIASSGNTTSPNNNERDGLKRFADVCLAAGTRPCAVTVLTTKSNTLCLQEFRRTAEDQVLVYLGFLLEAGFTDAVCSAEDVPLIRRHPAFNELHLNTPGIRPAGIDSDDQERVATPDGALKNGATRLVIGRPITTGDPAANLMRIFDSIRGVVPA